MRDKKKEEERLRGRWLRNTARDNRQTSMWPTLIVRIQSIETRDQVSERRREKKLESSNWNIHSRLNLCRLHPPSLRWMNQSLSLVSLGDLGAIVTHLLFVVRKSKITIKRQMTQSTPLSFSLSLSIHPSHRWSHSFMLKDKDTDTIKFECVRWFNKQMRVNLHETVSTWCVTLVHLFRLNLWKLKEQTLTNKVLTYSHALLSLSLCLSLSIFVRRQWQVYTAFASVWLLLEQI